MSKKNNRYIRVKDRKILWANSAGRCAKCKDPIIHGKEKERVIIGDEAHVIARDDKTKLSYEPIPQNEKDSYYNIVLLCASCHRKTANWSSKQLRELKIKHENDTKEILDGNFITYEVSGKLLKYTHIRYKAYQIPFNRFYAKLIMSCIIALLILLNILSYRYMNFELNKNLFSWACANLFGVLQIVSLHLKIKKSTPKTRYKGDCIVSGCNGIVHVQRASKDLRSKYSYLGICDLDSTHTFSVNKRFEIGNYEKIEPQKVIIVNK